MTWRSVMGDENRVMQVGRSFFWADSLRGDPRQSLRSGPQKSVLHDLPLKRSPSKRTVLLCRPLKSHVKLEPWALCDDPSWVGPFHGGSETLILKKWSSSYDPSASCPLTVILWVRIFASWRSAGSKETASAVEVSWHLSVRHSVLGWMIVQD